MSTLNIKNSKSYSEKEILEFNSAVKEKIRDWDSGKIKSNMKLGDSNTKSNIKKFILENN
jgi:hypothetical protein